LIFCLVFILVSCFFVLFSLEWFFYFYIGFIMYLCKVCVHAYRTKQRNKDAHLRNSFVPAIFTVFVFGYVIYFVLDFVSDCFNGVF